MESDVLLVSDDFMIVREKDALMYGLEAVSYTHLTLPTT